MELSFVKPHQRSVMLWPAQAYRDVEKRMRKSWFSQYVSNKQQSTGPMCDLHSDVPAMYTLQTTCRRHQKV